MSFPREGHVRSRSDVEMLAHVRESSIIMPSRGLLISMNGRAVVGINIDSIQAEGMITSYTSALLRRDVGRACHQLEQITFAICESERVDSRW